LSHTYRAPEREHNASQTEYFGRSQQSTQVLGVLNPVQEQHAGRSCVLFRVRQDDLQIFIGICAHTGCHSLMMCVLVIEDFPWYALHRDTGFIRHLYDEKKAALN
jgi:hypothetical protein